MASPQHCPCTRAASTASSTSNPAAIRELGVGFNILPHAIRVLAELDLLDELDAVAIRTRELIMMDRRGNEIWREARGLHAGYDVPQFSVHRGHLQGVLYRAVCERLGEAAVVVGRQLVSFEQDRDGVLARFCDQSGNYAETIRADGLIAADGIHSTVRAAMNPHEGPPRWNGVMMWRGATDWPKFLSGSSMIVAGGVDTKLVLYPIAPGTTPERRLTNWAVYPKSPRRARHRRGARTGRALRAAMSCSRTWSALRSARRPARSRGRDADVLRISDV